MRRVLKRLTGTALLALLLTLGTTQAQQFAEQPASTLSDDPGGGHGSGG